MIPGRCIEMATDEGDVVLDPFGGGGSTYEAAQRLKRYWLGSEITTAAAARERFKRLFPAANAALPHAQSGVFAEPDPSFRISIN
jgi:site-specific DNA-methyltransferase (adenine-specific)